MKNDTDASAAKNPPSLSRQSSSGSSTSFSDPIAIVSLSTFAPASYDEDKGNSSTAHQPLDGGENDKNIEDGCLGQPHSLNIQTDVDAHHHRRQHHTTPSLIPVQLVDDFFLVDHVSSSSQCESPVDIPSTPSSPRAGTADDSSAVEVDSESEQAEMIFKQDAMDAFY